MDIVLDREQQSRDYSFSTELVNDICRKRFKHMQDHLQDLQDRIEHYNVMKQIFLLPEYVNKCQSQAEEIILKINAVKEMVHKLCDKMFKLRNLTEEKKHQQVLQWLQESHNIWRKDKHKVFYMEYQKLYHSLSNLKADYLSVKHFVVEGQLEFCSIIFLPSILSNFEIASFAPITTKYLIFGYLTQHTTQLIPPLIIHTILTFYCDSFQKGKIKFYARNTLHNLKQYEITPGCVDLIPKYFNFIYGVVDSEDWSVPKPGYDASHIAFNILRLIRKQMTRKTIEMIQELEQRDIGLFHQFYDRYGENIKLGIQNDSRNRKRLVQLLRYHSTKTDMTDNTQRISLMKYVGRMNKETQQTKIYYVCCSELHGETVKNVLDEFKRKCIEVLYVKDKSIMSVIGEYNTKQLVNVMVNIK